MAEPTNPPSTCDPAKIRSRRVDLGLSQQQVADEAGISQGHISHVESGLRRPSRLLLLMLAKVLDCAIEDFASAPGGAA